ADEVARDLIAGISDRERRAWSEGSPADWADESFRIARDHVYGPLRHLDARWDAGGSAFTAANVPSGINGGGRPRPIPLDERYAAEARNIVAGQLQRAGVRLARLLNEALR
ncbi:MAG TPA: S1/P1 nuclease, partial [Steroidobacteraceae bacterium]|nr:S1/P1 nuclease [Steroidobacteraceae bacterium]